MGFASIGRVSLLVAPLAMASGALPAAELRTFSSQHTISLAGKSVPYRASVEEYLVNDGTGRPAATLVTTSYIRSDVADAAQRPVIFLFNGGPSAAAVGLHEQFGPLAECAASKTAKSTARICIGDNPNSLLDIADLVMFDPVETGYSRMLPGGDRSYFYSVAGDTDSLAQLVAAWLARHHREASPRYLLGESYGSIREVVTADLLQKRGLPLNGEIILGDSIFLMETSRRTHNIISTAVSLPLLGMTAAYHGKADKHGKSDAAYLDELYAFAMSDYLLALSKGHGLDEAERQRMATKLEGYTGIPAQYFREHDLTISKQDFNRMLLPGQVLDANDTRVKRPKEDARNQARGDPYAHEQQLYTAMLTGPLQVALPGLEYRVFAPESFERWEWGSGCNAYLKDAGLCSDTYFRRNIFVDYDWPEVLKRQFANPKFQAMIVAGYYDGLSSIGTHRYLQAQLGYPKDRFEIHEFAGGHMTAGDPVAQPLVVRSIKSFLARSH